MMNLQSRYEILSSAKVGIEFEMYSDLNSKAVCKELSKILGKRIVVPVRIRTLGEESKGEYHSDVEPTSTLFKLERDFSGGKDMYEMITGPLVYEEARIIIIKTLQWIKERGWTNEKCAIHLNISFNEFKVKLKQPLININILKFILGFDENFIYERFPNRKNSVYAKSINNFYPLNRFVFHENPENIDRNEYNVPHEKYFGVNFTKLPKNYLEFRYLGGDGYEKKTFKILEVLDYCIMQMYNTLQNGETYTEQEQNKLFGTLKKQKIAVRTFSDPEQFLMSYPNLQVTVDMKGDLEILKAFWTVLREKLFSLIVDSGLKEGHFNLDNDVSMFQLRDGIMKKANDIQDMELFDCEISGTIYQCDLYRCKINSSRITKCKLLEVCELDGCRVENTSIMPGNLLTDCYVSNPMEVIDGKMVGGVIRRGIIGKDAQISDTTLIINAKGSSKGTDKKDGESYMDAFSKNNKS